MSKKLMVAVIFKIIIENIIKLYNACKFSIEYCKKKNYTVSLWIFYSWLIWSLKIEKTYSKNLSLVIKMWSIKIINLLLVYVC